MPPTHDSQVLKKDVRWGEFKIGDLFENIQQGSRLKKLDQIEGDLPFIMAGTTNTGLVKFIGNEEVRRFPKNSITIDIFGNVFYRSYEYGAGDDTGIYWNENVVLSYEVMLYYCTSLEVALRGKFSYGKKLRSSQSHDIVVRLPVLDDGTIDFAYMRDYISYIANDYISDLETKRNLHLRAYLVSANLSTYELTNEDKTVLSLRPPQGEFVLSSLFDSIKRGRRIKSLDRIKGKLPFVTAGINERGISSYIGNPEAEIFPSNSLTIDMFGTVFYRDYEYGADDHVAVLYSTSELYNKGALLYIGMCIQKSIEGKFSYSRNFYASDAYDVVISLPILSNGTPDFAYMEAYIKAQSVKKIANVANEFNLKINAAKHIVQN